MFFRKFKFSKAVIRIAQRLDQVTKVSYADTIDMTHDLADRVGIALANPALSRCQSLEISL